MLNCFICSVIDLVLSSGVWVLFCRVMLFRCILFVRVMVGLLFLWVKFRFSLVFSLVFWMMIGNLVGMKGR